MGHRPDTLPQRVIHYAQCMLFNEQKSSMSRQNRLKLLGIIDASSQNAICCIFIDGDKYQRPEEGFARVWERKKSTLLFIQAS